MAKYVYPAVFSIDEEGYFIVFPDIDGCFTQGESLTDAMEMATDVLSLMMTFLEDERMEIPTPTFISELKTGEGEFATYIACDTDAYRKMLESVNAL